MAENKKKFLEGLNTYYKMKSKYEETSKIYKKIIKNTQLSWKEKRKEYTKFKPKCINCKRPVGTLFSSLYNPEENGRKLMAVCGDRGNPCPLNIVINLGNTTTYINDSDILEKEIIQLKNRIIKDKNSLIFGYISSEDAVTNFEDVKEELNLTLTNYELNLENYMNVTDNKTKNENSKKEQITVYELIKSIKELVSQYERNENVQLVRDAVEIYINQLVPSIEKLNTLQFSYRDIVYDSDDDTHHFIQKQYIIDEIETNYSKNKVGVEFFQTGIKNFDSKPKPKPLKTTNTLNKISIKPTLIIDSDEETEEERIPVSAPKQIDVSFVDSNGETYLFKAAQSGDQTGIKNFDSKPKPKPLKTTNTLNKISIKPTLIIDSDEETEEERIPVSAPKQIDVSFVDSNGETYLFKAAQSGDIDKTREQIENGADIHKKTNRGETILYGAVNGGNLKVVLYLLEHGAESDINVQANWGLTPLRKAINNNYLEIVEVLKNNGAK